jgi:hypothetical protein
METEVTLGCMLKLNGHGQFSSFEGRREHTIPIGAVLEALQGHNSVKPQAAYYACVGRGVFVKITYGTSLSDTAVCGCQELYRSGRAEEEEFAYFAYPFQLNLQP